MCLDENIGSLNLTQTASRQFNLDLTLLLHPFMTPPFSPSLVTETLKPLEGDRRCYHLVSGVLVERTVKDVMPMVEHNRDAVR